MGATTRQTGSSVPSGPPVPLAACSPGLLPGVWGNAWPHTAAAHPQMSGAPVVHRLATADGLEAPAAAPLCKRMWVIVARQALAA